MESHHALFGGLGVRYNLLDHTLDSYKLIEFVTQIVFSHLGCQGYDVVAAVSPDSLEAKSVIREPNT